MSIKLRFEGFDELIGKIEKAGGSVESATKQCLQKSARIMDAELKAQMKTANVSAHLISDMPAPTIEDDHGLITARVGYKKGAFDPHNLSTGYKVVMLNYGTPNRSKHGKVKARGFILKAKRKAKPKIKKEQEATLKDILKGL